jgi:predicted HTH transcriptional regulator
MNKAIREKGEGVDGKNFDPHFFNMKENEKDKKIVDFIKKEKVITSSELAEELKVSWNTAEKYLMELALSGKVERIKKSGVNLWMLK